MPGSTPLGALPERVGRNECHQRNVLGSCRLQKARISTARRTRYRLRTGEADADQENICLLTTNPSDGTEECSGSDSENPACAVTRSAGSVEELGARRLTTLSLGGEEQLPRTAGTDFTTSIT